MDDLFALVKLAKQLMKIFNQLIDLSFGTAAQMPAATYAERYITHQNAEQKP